MAEMRNVHEILRIFANFGLEGIQYYEIPQQSVHFFKVFNNNTNNNVSFSVFLLVCMFH